MLLKSIEINGFKSFARKSELIFTSKISAIVGPNGSGKSNVAEAFRFVLGEQSIKSLRGRRGEDLIWNGSGDIPKSIRASVKCVFDNSHKFLPIDFQEISLERIVNRDGSNEYFLNGSKVRLKDINELLAKANIGSSGHHIISQGEADRILNTSSKERKEMIEEALGLRLYEYRKIESQKKLEKTKENISQVDALRKEIAPHLRFLKKQVEKMQKAEELKKELVVLAKDYFLIETSYIKHEKEKLALVRKPIEENILQVKEVIKNAKKLLEKDEVENGLASELLSLDDLLKEIRQKINGNNHTLGQIEGELSLLLRNLKKEEEIKTAQDSKMVEISGVKNLYAQIEKYLVSIENSREEIVIKSSVEAIRSITKAFIELSEDKDNKASLIEIEDEIESLTKRKNESLREREQLFLKEKEILSKYESIKNKIEDGKEINREAEKTLFKAMSEEQELLNQITSIDVRENSILLQDQNFKRDSRELISLLGTELLGFENGSADLHYVRSEQEERRRNIERMKIRFEESGAMSGGDILKEYRDVEERSQFLEKELIDLENSANSLRELMVELEEKLSSEFKDGIIKINKKFSEFFTLMFGGGEASLSITKPIYKESSLDISEIDTNINNVAQNEAGIDVEVSLPKKKIKGLIQLSGGERALTSIALLFAISQINPPPFIILDETDAALDEANSRKYGDMVESLSKFSQLIVITHNRETMSRAGILYGITMGQTGGSKILSVAFEDAVTVAK